MTKNVNCQEQTFAFKVTAETAEKILRIVEREQNTKSAVLRRLIAKGLECERENCSQNSGGGV